MLDQRNFDCDRWALDLYAAALDGRPIEPVLQRLALGLDASRILVFRTNAANPAGEAYSRNGSHNIDPRALSEYAEHWVAHDPWLQAGKDKPPGVYDLREIAAEDAVVRTPFWNDFLRRYGPTLHGMTTVIEQREEVTGVLTLWREQSAGHFSPAALALLREVEPHVRRAFIAESRLSHGNLAQGALDTMPEGVAVIGASGALLHANAALLAMARQADGISLATHGLLAGTAAAQQQLDRLVGWAMGASHLKNAMPRGEGRLTLPRTSGGAPWLIDALPLSAARDGRFGGQPGVVLLVSDGEARRAPSEQLLSRTFGLTPSEAALAASLMSGASLAEHARRRRIAIPTARTHLARVLEKTGCRRQADLVAKLIRTLS